MNNLQRLKSLISMTPAIYRGYSLSIKCIKEEYGVPYFIFDFNIEMESDKDGKPCKPYFISVTEGQEICYTPEVGHEMSYGRISEIALEEMLLRNPSNVLRNIREWEKMFINTPEPILPEWKGKWNAELKSLYRAKKLMKEYEDIEAILNKI